MVSSGAIFDIVPHNTWLNALAVPKGIIPNLILLPTMAAATSVTVPSPPQAIIMSGEALTASFARSVPLISGVVVRTVTSKYADK